VDHRACKFRSHFSQENTPIHLLYPQGEESVEFVMRGHAVILAATLAWSISIKSAEAKHDILVVKATQRMLVIQDGYIRFMWPVSTGRDATQTPNGVYAPQRLERNWSSTAYYDSPMPFSIFFYNGYAIRQLRDRSTWGTRIAWMRALASSSRRNTLRPGATGRSEPDEYRDNGSRTPCGAIVAQARDGCGTRREPAHAEESALPGPG
jgi:hypothetical protein